MRRPRTDRKIPFGQHLGEPVWQEVPGEYRAMLRRLVVIQGDTEPASVEQQRHLGKTAPSLYDMRNVFQVNVEEGRHLWAMVYMLQKYFGRDGREEAEELLQRRSGDADKPRMLGAFNEATPDWLSFHMFTFFTDRDGKMQLESLAQSGFDPLSRTCRFMLTEEAHHMFVGETGIGRTIQRTCEAMKAAGIEDPNDIDKVRDLGVIDLPTMQKKLNLHYTLSLDLFGSEVSTNAANAFNAGLKGRFQETKIEDDHKLENSTYPVLKLVDGEIKRVDEPALTAINMRLRDDYTADCQRGLDRWNKIIERTGVAFKLELPHVAFHRQIGEFRDIEASPTGQLLDAAAWQKDKDKWLPSKDDGDFIQSLMKPGGRARQVRQLDRAAARRHRQQARRLRIREDRRLSYRAGDGRRSMLFGPLPRGASMPPGDIPPPAPVVPPTRDFSTHWSAEAASLLCSQAAMVWKMQLVGPAALLRQNGASPIGRLRGGEPDAASSAAAASVHEAIGLRMGVSSHLESFPAAGATIDRCDRSCSDRRHIRTRPAKCSAGSSMREPVAPTCEDVAGPPNASAVRQRFASADRR